VNEEKKACALCGEPVLIPGFTLKTRNELKRFCCLGCLCIYQILNEKEILPIQQEEKK
jgi:hypothetical protein